MAEEIGTSAGSTEITVHKCPDDDNVQRSQWVGPDTTVAELKEMMKTSEPKLWKNRRLRMFYGGPIGIGKEMDDDKKVLEYGTPGYSRISSVYLSRVRE